METDPADEPSESLFHSRRRWCCSCFYPCLDRLRTANVDGGGGGGTALWRRGVGALKKIREWSELVAGPRWKTFIRRFNRSGRRNVNLHYDPLSYAMNFDEGPGQNGHFEEGADDEYFYGSRNFSSRYARGSMDLGKEEGPAAV
ncbi:uncharacterized protein LOC127246095 [Andrographis paniculata]|uniref:uncharacterized protein LOC127246095 n=1 Tax=Andrographis paniculata TaxID=175694 RepID=UPI0021E70D6B|nr:uncharacterized protein LOC127246095 [Andrographis paniculata]